MAQIINWRKITLVIVKTKTQNEKYTFYILKMSTKLLTQYFFGLINSIARLDGAKKRLKYLIFKLFEF